MNHFFAVVLAVVAAWGVAVARNYWRARNGALFTVALVCLLITVSIVEMWCAFNVWTWDTADQERRVISVILGSLCGGCVMLAEQAWVSVIKPRHESRQVVD